jgi:CDP-glycerol glycerophosphotransferase (TagB/SpsB family)
MSVLFDNLGISQGTKTLLFASQPYVHGVFVSPDIRCQMLRDLFRAASCVTGVTLIVKPHPLEDVKELSRMARNDANIVICDKRLDIRNLIIEADAYATFLSTTTFDALVMDKPTINVLYPESFYANLFEHSGATIIARTAEDLERLFGLINSGRISELHDSLSQVRDRFLADWYYRLDGCASARIEEIAMRMANCWKTL